MLVWNIVVLGSYLFQLIVHLNPDFNCCSSYALSSVDSFNCKIKFCISYSKCCCLTCSSIWDQVRMWLISQLINGILRVLQKLLKYINGTFIWKGFSLSCPGEPVIFCLRLNKGLLPGKSTGLPSFKAGSSL